MDLNLDESIGDHLLNLKMSALPNLQTILTTSLHQHQQIAVLKFCVLSGGNMVHSNMMKMDSSVVNQSHLIHVGDRNFTRTLLLADTTNFTFGHFNTKKLHEFVTHFIVNF
jgi:hypothetical protein